MEDKELCVLIEYSWNILKEVSCIAVKFLWKKELYG